MTDFAHLKCHHSNHPLWEFGAGNDAIYDKACSCRALPRTRTLSHSAQRTHNHFDQRLLHVFRIRDFQNLGRRIPTLARMLLISPPNLDLVRRKEVEPDAPLVAGYLSELLGGTTRIGHKVPTTRSHHPIGESESGYDRVFGGVEAAFIRRAACSRDLQKN